MNLILVCNPIYFLGSSVQLYSTVAETMMNSCVATCTRVTMPCAIVYCVLRSFLTLVHALFGATVFCFCLFHRILHYPFPDCMGCVMSLLLRSLLLSFPGILNWGATLFCLPAVVVNIQWVCGENIFGHGGPTFPVPLPEGIFSRIVMIFCFFAFLHGIDQRTPRKTRKSSGLCGVRCVLLLFA